MDFLKLSTTTFEDPKIKLLRGKFGRDGYFTYIHVLYLIAQGLETKNCKCELPYAADTIFFDLGIEKEDAIKILQFCIDLGLLEGSAESTVTCKKILLRLDKSKLSPGMRKLINELPEPEIPEMDPSENPNSFKSEFFCGDNTEDKKEDMKTFSEKVFEIWESAKLPCKKGGLLSFLQGDFKNGLSELKRQNISTEDVLQAVKNYAETILNPNSWYTAKLPFESFCKERTIKRFTPDYYSKENFESKKSGSALNNSGADTFTEKVEF